MSKDFDLGDILSITTGALVSPRHIGGVYDILGYMSGESLMTHQLPRVSRECEGPLLAQHPQLADIVTPPFDGKESVLAWEGRHAMIREVDTYKAGGSKVFGGGSLFAGAFNRLLSDDLIAHLAAFDWPYPESTVVLIQPEEGSLIIWTPKLDDDAMKRDHLFPQRFIVGDGK